MIQANSILTHFIAEATLTKYKLKESILIKKEAIEAWERREKLKEKKKEYKRQKNKCE